MLTHLSGNRHGSLLTVTVCMFASRSITDRAYTSAVSLNKQSTSSVTLAVFTSCTILPVHL